MLRRDAAAAPSFDSARRREAADRAQTATTALLDLRSVSQWVRRVYQPELRRETDRSLSSPATAICILHVCESRPHATRCVRGARDEVRLVCVRHEMVRVSVGGSFAARWARMVLKSAHRNAGSERNVFTGREGRAAKNSVLTSGAKQLKCYCELGSGPPSPSSASSLAAMAFTSHAPAAADPAATGPPRLW